EDFEDDQDQPQHEQEQRQHRDTLVPVRPEEEHKANGCDDNGQADAGHFQFQHQADDADHDEQHPDRRQAQKGGHVIEPIRTGLADAARLHAVMRVQFFHVFDDELGDLQLERLLGVKPQELAVLTTFFHQIIDLPAPIFGLIGSDFFFTEQAVLGGPFAAVHAIDLDFFVEHAARQQGRIALLLGQVLQRFAHHAIVRRVTELALYAALAALVHDVVEIAQDCSLTHYNLTASESDERAGIGGFFGNIGNG